MPDVIQLAQKYKDALESLDEEALNRIVTAYTRIYNSLQDKIDALVMEIEALGVPTRAEVARLARYKSLIRQIEAEITKFQSYLETELLNASEASFLLASTQSKQMIQAILSQAGIQAQLGNLPSNAFEVLVSFLQQGSPLYDRIQLLSGTVADYVINTLLEGVALGKGPREIARLIGEAFGRGLTDALRMVRTAQLYASRVAAISNYQNNSDIVTGWVWFATLDDSVCQSCIAQHGTIHGLDETLNDHHNGRCAPLPYIPEFGNPIEQSGIDWFNGLSAERQKKILGQGKYDAWKAGKFTLDQLSQEKENDVYGLMRVEVPLKDLVK